MCRRHRSGAQLPGERTHSLGVASDTFVQLWPWQVLHPHFGFEDRNWFSGPERRIRATTAANANGVGAITGVGPSASGIRARLTTFATSRRSFVTEASAGDRRSRT